MPGDRLGVFKKSSDFGNTANTRGLGSPSLGTGLEGFLKHTHGQVSNVARERGQLLTNDRAIELPATHPVDGIVGKAATRTMAIHSRKSKRLAG
jgi:hypothetical protein